MSSAYAMKSPFDVFQLLPEGHEKALKQAFYNTAAIIFVSIVSVMALAVYYVMLPFLRPLLWALLCGSAIHPFNRQLTSILHGWLSNLSSTGTPLIVGTVILPFSIFDNTSELFAGFVITYLKKILFVAFSLVTLYCSYNFIPLSFLTAVHSLVDGIIYALNGLLELSSSAHYFVWSGVVGFLILISLNLRPQSRLALTCISMVLWLAVTCAILSVFGPLGLPLLLVFTTISVMGFFMEFDFKSFFSSPKTEKIEDELDGSFLNAIKNGLENIFLDSSPKADEPDADHHQSHIAEISEDQLDNDTFEDTPSFKTPKKPTSVPQHKRTRKRMLHPNRLSTLYLSGVIWACILAELWQHLWLLHLLFIPVVYILIKRIGYHFGIFDLLTNWASRTIGEWANARKDILLPLPLQGACKIFSCTDQKVKQMLEKSIGTVTSIFVIMFILVGAVLGTIFMSIQVYGESVHLVEVTGSVINRTLILPENLQDIDQMLDSMIGDAYIYGRQWISRSVQHLLDDNNENRAVVVENQMLKLWDEAYRLWISRNISDSSEKPSMPSWKVFVDGVKHLDMDLIVSFVKENIGTFMSVLDSVWAVLKGNITLALHVLTSSLSLAFGGGSAVLNFLLSFVIFSTALFYLLCASGQEYKPSELVRKLVPQSDAGVKFANAVEEAVNGVFAASFKMASFYGLYTWFIHTMFEVRIIYIPSVLASLFGAVPFLGAYWACLPAVLELWLEQGQGIKALLMLGCQFLPSFFVDSTIYSEIKGAGHPYLTGLAIAGGVFCLGMEGALFGPLLLCFLFVVMNIYSHMMQAPATSSAFYRAPPHGQLRRMLTVE